MGDSAIWRSNRSQADWLQCLAQLVQNPALLVQAVHHSSAGSRHFVRKRCVDALTGADLPAAADRTGSEYDARVRWLIGADGEGSQFAPPLACDRLSGWIARHGRNILGIEIRNGSCFPLIFPNFARPEVRQVTPQCW